MKHYFEINVFFSRRNTYSKYLMLDLDVDPESITEDDLLQLAEERGQITGAEVNNVVCIDELGENEYNTYMGLPLVEDEESKRALEKLKALGAKSFCMRCDSEIETMPEIQFGLCYHCLKTD